MEIIELLPRLHLLRFPVGGGAQVAGHANGSIGLYLPEPRVLFTGDTVARCSSRPARVEDGPGRDLAGRLSRRCAHPTWTGRFATRAGGPTEDAPA